MEVPDTVTVILLLLPVSVRMRLYEEILLLIAVRGASQLIVIVVVPTVVMLRDLGGSGLGGATYVHM